MPSRLAMVLSGDPAFEFGSGFPGAVGDPGFGFISGLIGGARAIARVGGRIFRRRAPMAITRASRVIAARPITTALAGGVAAGGAGAALETLLAPGAGGAAMGVPGGFQVLRVSRTGNPLQILTPQGRVISLRKRSRGISASAIRGAFRLARLAHAFGATARTGRRPRKRVKA